MHRRRVLGSSDHNFPFAHRPFSLFRFCSTPSSLSVVFFSFPTDPPVFSLAAVAFSSFSQEWHATGERERTADNLVEYRSAVMRRVSFGYRVAFRATFPSSYSLAIVRGIRVRNPFFPSALRRESTVLDFFRSRVRQVVCFPGMTDERNPF